MNFDEQKEKLSVKIDEQKAKLEEKKIQAKINHDERKLKMKESYADKKIQAHLEKTIKIIEKVEDDADKEVAKLLDAVDKEIEEEDEKPIEFIIFKATNKLEEILLKYDLKMQKAKNDLIKNLEKDMERVIELASIEEDLEFLNEEMDEISDILDQKITIEKQTLSLKSKE